MSAELAVFNRHKPLTARSVCQIVGYKCVTLTCRQVLTDLECAFGPTYVRVDDSQGPGVYDLTKRPMDPTRTADALNDDTSFRDAFGGSMECGKVGHLVCEARQHCWAAVSEKH